MYCLRAVSGLFAEFLEVFGQFVLSVLAGLVVALGALHALLAFQDHLEILTEIVEAIGEFPESKSTLVKLSFQFRVTLKSQD